MKLSDTACKAAKPTEKPYKKADGGGLHLLIKPNGSKLWRFKYRYLGKEKLLSIGQYPTVSLAQAREEREKARKLLANSPPVDPMEERRLQKSIAVDTVNNTFQSVAMEWHEIQSERWSKNYAYKILRGLELNVFPYIGNRPIAEITPPELLSCLKHAESRGSYDIAGRSKQICGQIFRYGIQTGRCERDAAADLKGALKTKKTEHFRTIDFKDVPEFLNALSQNKARLYERTINAVWLSLYTFCRPNEIRKARWSEIDFENALWTIPAERMKMDKDHIVPLSIQAMDVLKAQQEESKMLNTPWVFPSQIRPKNPMSDGTVNKAIKRLGYGKDMVAHGFRALARTAIREKLGYDSEIIEKQLAHKTKNPLVETYDRTQFIEERIKMMQDWADYLGSITNGK